MKRSIQPLTSYFLFLITNLLFFTTLSAQIYTDASVQLPNVLGSRTSMDVRVADLDKDGDLDIVLANEAQPNTILWNGGSADFTPMTISNRSMDSEDVAIADFNGDDHLDLVFCSEDNVNFGQTNVHEYYWGDGEGNFVAADFNLPDSEANAVITGDINGDNLPDLLFGNDGPTVLLLNDGDGSFTVADDRIPAMQRTTQDLLLVDLTGDGAPELIEGNEDGNLYFLNDGNGFFTDVTAERWPTLPDIETRKLAATDVDKDDDQDLVFANVSFLPGKNPQNRLLLNDGNGFFTDVTADQLPFDTNLSIDVIFEDIDLDDDEDMIIGNVFGSPTRAYRNNGNGFFAEATETFLGQLYQRDALGVIAADLNGDGGRDLYICDRAAATSFDTDVMLLRNMVSNTNELTASAWHYYPNPIRDTLYIEGPTATITDQFTIVDIAGRQLAKGTVDKTGPGRWQLLWPTHITSGTYIVQLGPHSFKISKE